MGAWLELNPLAKAGLERPRVLTVGGRGGAGKSGVPASIPAPPQTCWVSLGDYFPSLCFTYRKGGSGDLRGMLMSKTLGIRKQDSQDG